MNDDFAKRVKSAAVAGWWTILIAVIFSLVQWCAYMAILSHKPNWMLGMFGPDMNWTTIQSIMFQVMVGVKLVILAMLMAVIWLSIWACRLKNK